MARSLRQNLSHDVVLTPSDGTALGLMLARPVLEDGTRGPKRWQVDEIPTPTSLRVSQTGVGSTDFPPEMAAAVFREDHDLGMGAIRIDPVGESYMSGSVRAVGLSKIIKPPDSDEISLPTTEGDVRIWFEFEGVLFVSDGRYLHRSTDGQIFAQVLDVGVDSAITSGLGYGAADGDTGVVIGWEDVNGDSQLYYHSADGVDFQQPDDNVTREFSFFFVQDETLFGLDQPNTFRTTTDPFLGTAAWGTATQVGDELHKFQGGLVISGVLVIFKEDRVFTVDSAGTVSTLVGQFATTAGSRNFSAFATGFNSNIYFTVDEEVWEYEPVLGDLTELGMPRLPDTQQTPLESHTEGITFDGEAMYVLHHTNLPPAGTSIIRITERGAFVKERVLMQTPVTKYRPQGPFHYSRLFASLGGGRHLYFATTTAGKIGRLNLWRAADPTTDANSGYDLNDSLYRSGWMSHNFPGQPKDYTEILIAVNGVTPVPPISKINVFYYLDGDLSTRNTLATGLSANRRHRLEFSAGVTASTFLLELELVTHSIVQTPEVISWTVLASVQFDVRQLFTLTARLEDRPRTRSGVRSPHTADEIRDTLRNMRRRKNVTIQYDDAFGYSFANVRILPPFVEQNVVDEETGQVSNVLTFRVLRVTPEVEGLFTIATDNVAGAKRIGA